MLIARQLYTTIRIHLEHGSTISLGCTVPMIVVVILIDKFIL